MTETAEKSLKVKKLKMKVIELEGRNLDLEEIDSELSDGPVKISEDEFADFPEDDDLEMESENEIKSEKSYEGQTLDNHNEEGTIGDSSEAPTEDLGEDADDDTDEDSGGDIGEGIGEGIGEDPGRKSNPDEEMISSSSDSGIIGTAGQIRKSNSKKSKKKCI